MVNNVEFMKFIQIVGILDKLGTSRVAENRLSSLAFSIQRLSATVFRLRVIAAGSSGKQCGIYEIHTNRGNFGQAWYV